MCTRPHPIPPTPHLGALRTGGRGPEARVAHGHAPAVPEGLIEPWGGAPYHQHVVGQGARRVGLKPSWR
jgi:hypothetical protein